MDDPLKSTTNIRWLIVEKFNHRHLWDISNDNEDENIDGNEDLSYHMKTHLIATYFEEPDMEILSIRPSPTIKPIFKLKNQ